MHDRTRPNRWLRWARWYVCICPGPRALILEWSRDRRGWWFCGRLPNKPAWRLRVGPALIEKWMVR
jgi:hypothetical protein